MGENVFSLMAKDAGLVANASSDDKAGWDFEVEVPSPLKVNYSSQSRPVYRVQVKSTMSQASSVSMSFSSLLSLIQFGGPSFVFLACFDSKVLPAKAYLLHITEAKALEILTCIRKKEIANTSLKLNKGKWALKFEEQDRLNALTGVDLKKHLDEALRGTYLTYLEEKTKWLRKIEDDSIRRRFNIRFEDEVAVQGMADCFLGYERDFNVSSVQYLAPLGIPEKGVEHSDEFSATTIRPIESNLPRVLVRLGTTEYGPRYEFKGKIYTVPDNFPERYRASRIRTDLFDIVYQYEAKDISFLPVDLSDPALRACVKEFRGFVEYMAEARERKTTFIEVVPGDEAGPLKLTLQMSSIVVSEDFDDARASLNATYAKLAALGLADAVMSPSHLFQRPGPFSLLRNIDQVYDPAISFDFGIANERVNSDVTLFSSTLELVGKTVVFFAAFFGSVERLPSGLLRGAFSRSEYLGEVIVSDGHNLEIICQAQSDHFEELLKKRGFVVT